MTDASYLQPPHMELLHLYWPASREQAIRVAAIHRLLPDDADQLPGAVAYLMRQVVVELATEFANRPLGEVVWVAEALLHLALECRTERLPVMPARH